MTEINDDLIINIDYRQGGIPVINVHDDNGVIVAQTDLIAAFEQAKQDAREIGPDHVLDLANTLIAAYRRWLSARRERK